MLWATFLLLIVSGYVALKLFGFTQNRGRLKFLGLTITAVIFFLIQLGVFINGLFENPTFAEIVSFAAEWGNVICLAFILSSLAIFIRESKPAFAQFPLFYTALPLLIIVSYFLVNDTYALKNWLLSIYQGGAIIVALLMYSIYTYRRIEYSIILSGMIGFSLSYIFYWFVPGIQESDPWIWQLILGAGMIITVWGYETVESENVSTPSLTKSEI